jgi:hypothetical protein
MPLEKYITDSSYTSSRAQRGKNFSQVKSLITNNELCIVQRVIAQSNRIFRDCGVAEDPPGFQAGWSDRMYFSLFLLILFAHLEFSV